MKLPQRQYFYKDNKGKLRKFSYCCICGLGPFKESEKNFKFITATSKTGLSYCLRCYKTLGMDTEDVFDKTSIVNKETIEIVDFKDKNPKISVNKSEEEVEEIRKDPIRYDEVYEEKEEVKVIKKEPVKKEEPDRTGVFFIYLGQLVDDSYRVDITENIEEEIEKINSGSVPGIKHLPMEMLYYHMVTSWKQALFDKDQIMHMSASQKEELINNFITKVFKE